MGSEQARKTYCVLPWMHLNINANGSINPCCATTDIHQLGNINDVSLNEAWNSTKLKSIRTEMLNNKIPKACEVCHIKESYGLESDRQRANSNYSNYAEVSTYTEADGGLGQEHLKSIDIRFSNFCNFSCRICRPVSSTGWYPDAKLLGFKHINLESKITPTKDNIKLMQEMADVLPQLDRMFFVGGEPLLQKEHYETLENLISLNKTNTRLDYVTNLSHLKFGIHSALKCWKNFDNVCLSVSLDGVNKQGEYLRKGLNWQQFVQNVSQIRSETPHVKILILSTISIHNVYHFTELIKVLINDLNFNSLDLLVNILNQPSYYSVQALPENEKILVKRHYESFLTELKVTQPSEVVDEIEIKLKAILKFMFEKKESEKFSHFITMTKRVDFLRSESFEDLFIEFKNYF